MELKSSGRAHSEEEEEEEVEKKERAHPKNTHTRARTQHIHLGRNIQAAYVRAAALFPPSPRSFRTHFRKNKATKRTHAEKVTERRRGGTEKNAPQLWLQRRSSESSPGPPPRSGLPCRRRALPRSGECEHQEEPHLTGGAPPLFFFLRNGTASS